MNLFARYWPLALMAIGLAGTASAGGPTAMTAPSPSPTEITAGMFVFAEPEGNVLLRIGSHDSIVVGTLAPRGTAAVLEFLATRHAPAVRFALAVDGPDAARYGDGGWGRAGATTIAHERLRARISAQFKDGTPHDGLAGLALPILGFSQVQQMYVSDDEVHAVHQQAGPGDADLSVHFEGAGVLFLGTLLSTDGYPTLDLDDGGSVDGLVKTVEFFAQGFAAEASVRFVPGRGATADGAGLVEYLQMLRSARSKIQALIAAGLGDGEIVARGPLQELDARWGRGPVSSRQFTTLLVRSLRPK
jgi:hypothetical protein